jgi:hypothetical protein
MLMTSYITLPEPFFSLFLFRFPGGSREIMLVIGTMVLISLLVLGSALFMGKPRRRRHQPRRARTPAPAADQETSQRKWRRRRRQDRRPRNPTLAETGGLPPARPGPPIDPGL